MRNRTTKQENYFKKFFIENSFEEALEALKLINKYHKGVRRDGSEERGHMFDVLGFTISNFHNRVNNKDLERLIVAAALHDLVEDYKDEVSFKCLKEKYNISLDTVKTIKKVTKWSTFKKIETHYDHYYKNILKDKFAIIVKASDRLHNLNSCTEVFSTKKKKEYINETKKYIIPALKNIRRTDTTLYIPITGMIYDLKNQIKQLEYIIILEDKISELSKV